MYNSLQIELYVHAGYNQVVIIVKIYSQELF